MKKIKLLGLGLGLVVLVSAGCNLISAQILTHFDLPNPFTINSLTSASERVPVDLSVDVGSDYNDHKDKLKGLLDVAILGKFTNVNGPAGALEVWIAPTYDTPAGGTPTVPGNAVLLWGPATIGASPSTRIIDWDASAALFNKAGRDLLISEVKGDGRFTLYTRGTAGTYEIRVDDGVVVLVLDAAK